MSVPLELDPGTGSGSPDAVPGPSAIEGRSLGQIAWRRLRRDKVAIAGGLFLLFLVFVAILAPLIVKVLGDPPNEFHENLLDFTVGGVPKGAFGGISWDHLMGLEPQNGRDVFVHVNF